MMDEVFGKRSPLDSVLKMENMMRCCKSNHDSMHWCMQTMADQVLNRMIKPQEMQPNFLFGAKGQKGNLGCHYRCTTLTN